MFRERYCHSNWKTTDKRSLLISILKISRSNYHAIIYNFLVAHVKFVVLSKSSVLSFAMQAMEIVILVTPWKDNAFVTKGFRSWKKALCIEKNKPGAFKKHSQSDSYKSTVENQITLAPKSYGKIPKMASKSSANEQKENREILLKILENVKFLGKTCLI